MSTVQSIKPAITSQALAQFLVNHLQTATQGNASIVSTGLREILECNPSALNITVGNSGINPGVLYLRATLSDNKYNATLDYRTTSEIDPECTDRFEFRSNNPSDEIVVTSPSVSNLMSWRDSNDATGLPQADYLPLTVSPKTPETAETHARLYYAAIVEAIADLI